jgi:hypothetical protein
MQTVNSVSQIGQDYFVIQILNNLTNGYFLDIGCAEPIRFSNTYILEKYFNWKGIGIDILDASDKSGNWKELRPNTKHIIEDALKIDYKQLLVENKAPKNISYLSLDLEPPELTLECLRKIPFDDYIFSVITFETDEYRKGGVERAEISRNYLQSFGYKLHSSINKQDDVYVHSSIIK